VERLPGIDAGYLYMETPTLLMHTLKVAILRPGDDYSATALRDALAARLHLLPPFRRRLVDVPLRLHHPVWVDDADIDLDAHVHRLRVPAPGGMRELEGLIGDIAGAPLDRRRPLWEVWVCEGMADGRLGVVTKMHHALADGVASSALLANVMDAVPAGPVMADPAPASEPWRGEPTPRRWRLLREGVRDWGRQLTTLPALLVHTGRRVGEVARVRKGLPVRPPRPILDAPRTSFNGAITARRSFATARLPLADFRAVQVTFGVSLNDVVLAVAAGALRSWLAARDELPARSLLAAVPLAVPGGGEVRLSGNRVSSLLTSLCTDVADPVDRLRAISAVTGTTKAVQEALGADMMERWVQFTPPAAMAGFMRAYSRLRGADRHRPPVNVVVSNVPGPRQPVSIGGAQLAEIYSVGPILEGIGLNLTVWSYVGEMAFSALACPDTLPDLHGIVDRLAPALGELLVAAGREELTAS